MTFFALFQSHRLHLSSTDHLKLSLIVLVTSSTGTSKENREETRQIKYNKAARVFI